MFQALQKLFCLVLMLIFSIQFSFAQTWKLDSLQTLIKTAQEDTNKIHLLNVLGSTHTGMGNYEQAFIYTGQALRLSQKLNFKRGEVDAYNTNGMTFWNKGEFDSALQNIFIALKIAEQAGYKPGVGASHLYSGMIYDNQSKLDDALKSYNAALKIWCETGNKIGEASCLNNIGNIYGSQGKNEEALKYHQESNKILIEFGNKDQRYMAYGSMAQIYENEGNLAEALKYCKIVLEHFEEIGSNTSVAGALLAIGRINMKQNQLDEAIKNCSKAFSVSKKLGHKQNSIFAAELLTEAYSRKGNYKQALEMHKLYLSYKDSVLNETNSQNLNEMQTKYETEKKEKENEKLKAEKALVEQQKKEEEQKRYMSMGIAVVLLISVVGGGYAFYNNRQNKNKLLLQKSELEKSLVENNFLRSRMDPHFVSNALLSVNDFVSQKKNKLAQEYLERFNQLMRWILENSSRDLVTLAEELEMLSNYLILENPRIENGLQWNITIADGIDAEEIELPPLILQPFVENAIKHGISGLNREGKIEISVSKAGNKITCTIEDNGRGIKEEIKETSKGLKLTRERLELFSKLNGADAKLEIIPLERGTRVIVSFNA